ncbi:MAG TPA: glycosyltransferase [Acidobacteriaceae bacterium]|nr:glycosyltransferase [Acidobacteriaceae bacterium]
MLKNEAQSLQDEAHGGPPIVCLSGMFWDEHWSSQQQLMSRLAARCRILYVERPVSLLSFFTGISDASVGRQFWRWLKGGLRYESPTLAILTPPPIFPLRFHPIVNRVNEWMRLRSVRRAMRALNLNAPILWIYEPDAGRAVGRLGEAVSLYYCADDWAAAGQWWNIAQHIRAREEELALRVDLIAGTSTKIVKRWAETHPDTFLVSNGADVESFRMARNPEIPIPEDLLRIPAPRIGYIGFVDGRFDTALYERLTQRHPEWQWVIIGPLMEKHVDLSRLRQRKNVHFFGPRTRAELPAYLKGLDVCTIPYLSNVLTESVFPLKLFEYLGAGRPVVSTGLPELAPFREYVQIAPGPEEFEEGIRKSLSEPLPAASDEFLAGHSWDAKADYLWNLLIRAVQNKAGSNHGDVSRSDGETSPEMQAVNSLEHGEISDHNAEDSTLAYERPGGRDLLSPVCTDTPVAVSEGGDRSHCGFARGPHHP